MSEGRSPLGPSLEQDRERLPELLEVASAAAREFLVGLDARTVAQEVPPIAAMALPEAGLGAEGALRELRERYEPFLSGSPGPRYFAFVTGGSTPAALVGDWLAAAWDQNLADADESSVRQLAVSALGMVRELLGLPESFGGTFVTGATTSNLTALATARQWVGEARGVDLAIDGLGAEGLGGPVVSLSGTPHSSIFKALSVLGLGRASLRTVATLSDREAVDVDALEAALQDLEAAGAGPAIVVANAGTVNTCDFDDLAAIVRLRERHRFWLHVDGAFGAVAAASPRFRPWLAGLDGADSVTVDAHKWLNVPYDGAVVLTRHLELQGKVFASLGPYLPLEVRHDTFAHLTPENSQRVRALPVWMTLAAYGREGYAAVVERCSDHAAWLGERIEAHSALRLLAPVRLNGVCFTLEGNGEGAPTAAQIEAFLGRLRSDGTAFMTPTVYRGVPAARVSVTNWRTRREDMERTWEAMVRCLSPAST